MAAGGGAAWIARSIGAWCRSRTWRCCARASGASRARSAAARLDRRGFPPERDLPLALQKDGGIDPGILAWLLAQFPTSPLPLMLEPLAESELRAFRDVLRERMRRLAVPES
jgi:hypothetical protein